MGLRLWGMAEEPFCVLEKGSWTSLNSVFCRARISVAILSKVPPMIASVQTNSAWRSRCRICVEIGAHIIKTYYCENFNEVVEACGNVPVVIAGGKKIGEKDALQMASNAIRDGASGVDMGRNIFQSDNPIGMIKAVRAVVHENLSVDEAFKIYEDSKK